MEPFISETDTRVERNTSPEINRRLLRQLEANVIYFAERMDQIDSRLRELDREWDIERVLQTQASSIVVVGLTLGLFNRRWLVLPMLVGGFLLQHSLQGWCPPVPILRRLGIRTNREINRERYALKALRGDFREVNAEGQEPSCAKAIKALQAADGGEF